MALKYVNYITSKVNPWQKSPAPVLTEEDEAFLQRVTSNPSASAQTDLPQETPQVRKDPQIALMDGAQNIPLPLSPTEEIDKELPADATDESNNNVEDVKAKSPEGAESLISSKSASKKKKSRPWSWMRPSSTVTKKKDQKETAASLTEIVTKSKTPQGQPISAQEQQQELEDMTAILERLNLAAENNRVFSISAETQELLHKFKLIFKDLVTGVPTAYRDLESLLTNGDKQLRDAFGHLPSFLKKLVEQLPERLTEMLAPELLAVAGEKASQSGLDAENAGKAAASAAAKKLGLNSLSLKELVGTPTAVVGVLRSIIGFLRARFPAVVSMNVLWSLALFIVLLVLWYCHKRGREVRLENERLVTEAEITKKNAAYDEQIRATETLNTTAPKGASIGDVHEGVQRVQEAREAALLQRGDNDNDNVINDKTDPGRAPTTATTTTTTSTTKWTGRRFSFLKSTSKKGSISSDIRPYPGT
ncbi:hypothetical protein VTN77DRAFT_8178 [Rasamsonia byssochlamydoides]|uniref:uncharacterized protein n=1 Tax=Rasamsonia byssochlamydoides TaxID=89139 RepID=UPI003743B459